MFLTKAELISKYYTLAEPVADDKQELFLLRANAWCKGYIGGIPPTIHGDNGDDLKTAVALCFEVMARGETSQIDADTGNITEVAPPTAATKTTTQYAAADQFSVVRQMLRMYKLAFENTTNLSDRGVKFI